MAALRCAPGKLIMEGKALRSLVDAFKFTLTYPDWCKQKGITLSDFVEWMQVRGARLVHR